MFKEQLTGYHRVAGQMETIATVEIYYSRDNANFYAVVDSSVLWGPFTISQMTVAMRAFDDITQMQGTYNAIPD